MGSDSSPTSPGKPARSSARDAGRDRVADLGGTSGGGASSGQVGHDRVLHGAGRPVEAEVVADHLVQAAGRRIVIADEGEGYEPTELPDPLAEENLLRQSGRGLLLIRAFVDEFTMRKAPPLGTEIKLVVSKNKQEA